jgi:hypothetical protein
MPLRAIIDGHDVIAPFLSADEWENLRLSVKSHQKELQLPCCQNAGHLRTSKLGTNHFVHNRKEECDWKSETPEHLKAKNEIALACHEAGYEVTTEESGAEWRADVLASKGSARIAFQILWNRQTLEETQRRQDQYRRDGIRGCWFFKIPPKEMKEPMKELPLFSISSDSTQTDVSFSVGMRISRYVDARQPSSSLYEFVKALLNRKIKFCSQYKMKRQQRLRIVFIEMECWRCKKVSHIFYLSNQMVSCCGESMSESEGLWESEKPEFNKAVLDAVRKFINSPQGSHLKLGRIKPRYSKTVNKSYRSFGCYHCDAIFGNWFISEETMHARYHSLMPHWRLSASSGL